MEKQRFQRLIKAAVAGGVILLTFLIVVLIFQVIVLVQTQRKLNAMRDAEKEYRRMIDEAEDEIEIWRSEEKIKDAAREYYGFRSGKGK